MYTKQVSRTQSHQITHSYNYPTTVITSLNDKPSSRITK